MEEGSLRSCRGRAYRISSGDDAHAIVTYLRSLPPIKKAVPGPFGPKEVPSTLVFVIVPGDVYAKMPAPP